MKWEDKGIWMLFNYKIYRIRRRYHHSSLSHLIRLPINFPSHSFTEAHPPITEVPPPSEQISFFAPRYTNRANPGSGRIDMSRTLNACTNVFLNHWATYSFDLEPYMIKSLNKHTPSSYNVLLYMKLGRDTLRLQACVDSPFGRSSRGPRRLGSRGETRRIRA